MFPYCDFSRDLFREKEQDTAGDQKRQDEDGADGDNDFFYSSRSPQSKIGKFIPFQMKKHGVSPKH